MRLDRGAGTHGRGGEDLGVGMAAEAALAAARADTAEAVAELSTRT